MSRIYTDYFNQTVLTIPDKFIDVKTGDSQLVPPKIIEEIDYHSENNTLQHLILSALNEYFHKTPVKQESTSDVLTELLEMKKMLKLDDRNRAEIGPLSQIKPTHSEKVNIKEIEDVLEAFGG